MQAGYKSDKDLIAIFTDLLLFSTIYEYITYPLYTAPGIIRQSERKAKHVL